MTATILIVDDEPVQRRLLEASINRMGYRIETANGGEAAIARLSQIGEHPISAVVLDLVMPDLDGMGVLGKMRDLGLKIPVIVQTSQGSIDTVVSAMRAGAHDFVVKPASAERLQVCLRNALAIQDLGTEVQRIKKRSEGRLGFKDLITDSANMGKVIKLGERAAASNIPVLIEGESGVGKEIIARAIQGSSDRAAKPFVTVNCGAIPENLVESILFGHEKGAFTGATESHTGKFREAHGGTIFLDEVGELPADIQVKLLRTLQEGEIDPVGASKSVKVDFRLISATNRDLLEQVKSGAFREDLFYRLNVFPVRVPPLRERKEDIPELVRHFAAKFALEEGHRPITEITQNAINMLMAFDWPGNIRQLENSVFRAVILADAPQLSVEEFPQIANLVGGYSEPSIHAISDQNSVPAMESAPVPSTEPMIVASADSLYGFMKLADSKGVLRPLAEVEKESIEFALEYHNQHMTKVAKSLGIGRSTLYRKLREYGLDEDATGNPDDDAEMLSNLPNTA